MDTFSGHRSTVSHQSVHPSNPLPCQDRECPHPPGKIARSHFVFKVLASEFFFFFFAWRLPKPAVWDESLIIHHRLQTQVVQVLGMQPEPAQVHVHPDGCSGSVPRGFSGAARGPPPQPCWHLPVEPRPNGFLLWFCSLGMRTDGRTDGRSWRVAATMPYSQRSQCFSTRMVQPQPSAAFQKSLLQHRKRRPHDQAN